MLKYCLGKWEKYKGELEKDIRQDTTLNECDYLYLVQKIVSIILNGGEDEHGDRWSAEKITEIDNGDYQGTLLFLIPKDTYQPSEYEYLMTFVNYGSCSGCDTLQAIQDWGEKKLVESQVRDFMTLCRDLVCSIIKPYNKGWREEPEFETIEYNPKD